MSGSPSATQAERAVRSRNPAAWLSLFGPGAIIASLTIGSGELIFSTRGGALFGYRLLGVFLVVCLFKWGLVFATARHMVLTAAHPFQRWMALPGPRGWLPMAFLLLGVLSFPVWVGFHAGVLGTLLASLFGMESALQGSAHLLWAMAVLAAVMLLAITGGYRRLEKIQLVLVFAVLLCALGSLILLRPDWLAALKGFLPGKLSYPEWVGKYPDIAARPAWLEISTYVGVVGGSGYDYLAYTSYLRDKNWGRAGAGSPENAAPGAREWIRAPLIDCTLSFAAVFLFSAVFVAGGAIVLGARQEVPAGGDLLTLQASFVGAHSSWLRPLYFAGAFLAMLGTLYGTIEVAPAILREISNALRGQPPANRASRRCEGNLHRWAVLWVGVGGLFVLAWLLIDRLFFQVNERPPQLVALLIPANLFTGVLACGILCFLSNWADRRWLPATLRPPGWLVVLNAAGGCLFLAIGFKAYWDHSGATAYLILAGTLALAWGAAWWRENRRPG